MCETSFWHNWLTATKLLLDLNRDMGKQPGPTGHVALRLNVEALETRFFRLKTGYSLPIWAGFSEALVTI
jgi:hypothetical protein